MVTICHGSLLANALFKFDLTEIKGNFNKSILMS